MTNERLQKIKELSEKDPGDLFYKYALAIEYLGVKDFTLAKKNFREVISTDKKYVAAYYQLGKIFEREGDEVSALQFFNSGLILAKEKNQQRDIREFQAAISNLV